MAVGGGGSAARDVRQHTRIAALALLVSCSVLVSAQTDAPLSTFTPREASWDDAGRSFVSDGARGEEENEAASPSRPAGSIERDTTTTTNGAAVSSGGPAATAVRHARHGARSVSKNRTVGGRSVAASALPRLTEDGLHVAERAATFAMRSQVASGSDKASVERQERLAAFYYAQRRSIASFTLHDDIPSDGKCKREIEALCRPSEMNPKFLKLMDARKAKHANASSTSSTSADPEIAARRRRVARALLDVGAAASTEVGATKEGGDAQRIADLEAKVNALAGAIASGGNASSAAEAPRTSAGPKRHRPYRSYFECIHWNIVEDRGGGISYRDRVMNPATAPAAALISAGCRAEVRNAYKRRFKDVRRDQKMMLHCGGGGGGGGSDDNASARAVESGLAVAGGDIAKFCAGIKPGLGLIFRCLKAHKLELTPACASVVSARQIEQAEDMSLDTPLALMCADDRAKLCKDTAWGGGLAEQCLKERRVELSTQCKLEIFRREVEESEDVRYDAFLSDMCAGDKKYFCDAVKPGEGRVMACLESHASDAKFSADCRAIIDRRAVRRAADWRLDFGLRRACSNDVMSVCRAEVLAAKSKVSASGKVLECLKFNLDKDNIADDECKREVEKKMVAAAADIRQDTALTLTCKTDLTTFCAGTAPGGGRLWKCLEKHRKKVSPECEDKLFEREMWMSGDWRFKYGLASSCASERQLLCKGIAPGDGRVIRCLREKQEDPKMGAACRKAVFEDQARSHNDIRLHHELRTSCDWDTKALCPDVEPGEGRVIKCLRDMRAAVKVPDCRAALLRIMMSSADNYLLDAPLAAACTDDVKRHCADVVPGQGRVHECLRYHADNLTSECRLAEVSAEAVEVEDIRLKPRLLEACETSAAELCSNVKPGNGRLLECLLGKAESPEMNEGCRQQLRKQVVRQNSNLAFNLYVKHECSAELPRLCRSDGDEESIIQAAAEQGREDPLACLIDARSQVSSEACGAALVQTVNRAFKFYEPGMAATRACDDVAHKRCGAGEDSSRFQAPGSVLGCLQRATATVSDACWVALSATLVESALDRDAKAAAARIEKSVKEKIFTELREKFSKDSQEIVEETRESAQEALDTAVERVTQHANKAEKHEAMVRTMADHFYTLVTVVGLGLLSIVTLALLAVRRLFSLMAMAQGRVRMGAGGNVAHRSQTI